QTGLDKDWFFILRDWETGKARNLGTGGPTAPLWINDERVLFGYGSSVDRDGKNLTPLGPAPQAVLFHSFTGAKKDDVLAVTYDMPVMGSYQPLFVIRHYHVQRFLTRADRSI